VTEESELKKAGLKVTLPRLRILELLESSELPHLSAEDVYRKLINSGEEVGLATVYRVLTQFEQAGICIRHNFEDSHGVYELTPTHHHDHMICIETGDIIEFTCEDIENFQDKVAKNKGYEIVDHTMVLYVKPLTKK
tara:strand:+ start:58 stop:468 length:411 start_codon:yes stop_codon:yes gene_type:complete